jgi:uncharacterized protein YecE (DUF72 family)
MGKVERKHLYVGTSGWTYSEWRGRFYPEDLPHRDWLSWYARRFIATEVNASFYRTPSLDAVAAWRDQAPAGFRFAWKASKFITHWKRPLRKFHRTNGKPLGGPRLKMRTDIVSVTAEFPRES